MGENIARETTDKGLIFKTYKQLMQLNKKKSNKTIGHKGSPQKWVEDLKRQFSKKEKQMVNKHMKRCSKLLTIREMQIKATMRYHLTPIKMAIIKKSTNSKFWRGCGEKGMLLYCWWECKLIQPLWKMESRFLKELWIKPPYDPAVPLLGTYPEETKMQKDTCIPLFIAALFTIARTCKQPRYSLTDEWIKKLCHIYTMEYYNRVLFSHKNNEILPFAATCVDLENIMLWSKSDRKRQILYDITYV